MIAALRRWLPRVELVGMRTAPIDAGPQDPDYQGWALCFVWGPFLVDVAIARRAVA